jgi:hypothetical protein
VVKWIDTCYELSAQHARFISVSHTGGASSAYVDQSIPQIKVMELHAKLALKLNDQSLVAVIQVGSLRSSGCVLQHSNTLRSFLSLRVPQLYLGSAPSCSSPWLHSAWTVRPGALQV